MTQQAYASGAIMEQVAARVDAAAVNRVREFIEGRMEYLDTVGEVGWRIGKRIGNGLVFMNYLHYQA